MNANDQKNLTARIRKSNLSTDEKRVMMQRIVKGETAREVHAALDAAESRGKASPPTRKEEAAPPKVKVDSMAAGIYEARRNGR